MILGIYGAGGLGREVYELALSINAKYNKWQEIFFLDDSQDINNLRNIPIHTFEETKKIKDKNDLEVCVAVGEPSIRMSLYKKLKSESINIATLIHPEVTIPESTHINEGTIICKFVSITCDISIGKNVYIHPMVCIGHDASIGDNSVILSFVDVAGNCIVGNRVFLAINVVLKQGVTVGDDSIVGLASVVYKNIPNSVIALGNPARPMKNNLEKKVFK